MGEQRTNIGVMGLPELKAALERQAKREGRSTSNLSERLLQWAMEQVKVAGDSQVLTSWSARPGYPKSGRISEETQEALFAALGAIIERAPSPIIVKVEEFLNEWGGKYAGEGERDSAVKKPRRTKRA